MMQATSRVFDVVGVGLNATDTILVVPHFPAYGGKVPFTASFIPPADRWPAPWSHARAWDCEAKYIGRWAMMSAAASRWKACAARRRPRSRAAARELPEPVGLHHDRSIDRRTHRFLESPGLPPHLPEQITPDQITCARLLHIDGHDTPAVEHAARIARAHGIPVTVDVDTIYPGFDRVLPLVDYLIASSEFPGRWTRHRGSVRGSRAIQRQYGMRVAAMTLGAHGALALAEGRFIYSPAFVVDCVDTTGAGDVFHGAFCYAVLQQMPLAEALDFSNAMAALELHRNRRAGRHRAGFRDVRSSDGIAEPRRVDTRKSRAERRQAECFLFATIGRPTRLRS